MKKAKILTVLGVLLAMGITACGGKPSDKPSEKQSDKPAESSVVQPSSKDDQKSSNPGQSSGGDQDSSTHTHSFGEWKVVKAPTCTENGSEERVCACGEKQTRVVLAHHAFGTPEEIAASEAGKVGYKKSVCSIDGAIGIEIELKESMLDAGAVNKDDPKGFIKLKGNDQSFSFSFDYPSNAKGKIYQRGVMDSYSNNKGKNVFSGGSNGATDFELRVNNNVIDVSSYKSQKWSDIMGDYAEDGNLSPITDVESGAITLSKGTNTVSYKRLASYNLAMTHIVFVVEDIAHEHQFDDSVWQYDENQHWHACIDENCPTHEKSALADHIWEADPESATEEDPDVEVSCSQEGRTHQKCLCGAKRVKITEKLPHNYEGVEWSPVEGEAATCEHGGKEQRKCKNCDYVDVRETAKLPHSLLERKAFAADEEKGTSPVVAKECDACHVSVLEWKAADFNAALSTKTKEVKEGDVVVGVQMTDADKLAPANNAEGTPDATVVGTRYVYKIESYAAAENVVLSFDILTNNNQWGNPDIFTAQRGDWTPGYVEGADGQLVKSEYRYGLFVNGQSIQLGKDLYGALKNVRGWFDFNAQFNLIEGVNTIEILCLGGYPAQAIYGYRLTGLPHLELAHEHTLSEWQSDENNHWKVCTDPACPDLAENPDAKIGLAAHNFIADAENSVAATCTEDGVDAKICSVCGKQVQEVIPALGHQWVADPSQTDVAPTCEAAGIHYEKCNRTGCTATRNVPHYKDVGVYNTKARSVAAEGGAVAYDIYNCETAEHSHSAYVWSALDFDVTETTARSDVAPDTHDDYVRFGEGAQYKDKNENAKGTHFVYKVFVPEGVTSSILSMKSTNRAKDTNGLFAWASNDGTKGYEKVDGKFVEPTHRYGLVVNGVRVSLGYDDYPTDKNDKTNYAWFSFPANITLIPGQINEIEIFTMGGYRLQMQAFRLSNMPAYISTHTHEASSEWSHNETQHWHACVAEGCDDPTIKLDAADHIWDDGVVTLEPTHTSEGQKTYTCTVCHATKVEAVDKVEHTWGEGGTKIGGAVPHECTGCSTVCYDLDFADTSNGVAAQKLKTDAKWDIEGLPAGTYEIRIYACAAATTLPQAFLDNGTGRYQWRVDEGSYVNPTAGTYADFGLGTGEAAANCKWSKVCNTIAIGEGAKVFEMHWTNKGYSAFISAVRLVKVA